jgi:ubiquinone biosynthesis protein
MGALPEVDKNCLAMIFIAFFKRDYKAVALAHIEAGWVPPDTGLEELEGAIRSVCEPIFDKPLKDIYFGKLLLRLFEVGRRFRMDIQPQLVLLQKTLLQVEGLGRHLDPELDLRSSAQPILERWMNDQVGPRGLWRRIRHEAPTWSQTIPQIPRLVHKILADDAPGRLERAILQLEAAQRRQTRILLAIALILGFMVLGLLVRGV